MARRVDFDADHPPLATTDAFRKTSGVNDENTRQVEEFGRASPAPLSDDDLALKLVGDFGPQLRYVAMWNKWLRYSTSRCTWQFEETLAVFDMARAICRKAYRNNASQKGAALLTSARMAGYMLTGSTQEHALFFLWGAGANGKSVFLSTLSGVLGSYATTAPIETFTASSHDRHPTDLAMLRGARLVTATETEEGRRWAEAKIKQMTGGDKISARFVRQDFFEYSPTFKLLIAGNHKPGLRSVDEAIRRRFHLVPFAVTIPPDERDPKLAEKLKSEWPAILQWAIEGYHDWIERGLAPPDAVRAATDAYLESEDATAGWIQDCCECERTSWEPASALYASFKGWAEKAGEYVPSQKRFGQNLEARNVIPERTTGARGYRGLRIIQPYGNKVWEPD